jgi:predicted house-cleaning noncanonical NTP pyrophosphatase (MazG superfamily)
MPIYNKLVRDRIPKIISMQGKHLSTRILDAAEFMTELRTKLQEETNEYLDAESHSEAVEELADILELLHALAESHGVTVDELEQIRSEKAVKRGGFKERIFLIEVEDEVGENP